MNKTCKNTQNFIQKAAILRFFAVLICIFSIVCFHEKLFANTFFASAVTKKNELTSAEGMVVIESLSGRLLYSKDENKRLPMASTTKILTAIVAIESGKDLDEKHLIPDEAVGIEGSTIYLKKGEHLTLRELLFGLMLRSGNDSAVAIAIIVAGSVENFVQKMNDYCSKLGLKDTHIVTVNGLHDDAHYTTAFELAKITAYAMKNSTFAEIVKTKETKIDNEKSKKNNIRFLKNKNKLLRNLSGADGVKTGYTKKAGRCFVGSATRGNMQVICVVLNCVPMFEDTQKLIEKAFDEYSLIKLMSKGEISKVSGEVKKANGCSILLENDIFYPLKKSELDKVKGKIVFLEQPLKSSKEKQQIATFEIRVANDLIFSEKLYTIFVEEETKIEDSLKKIIDKF